VVDVVSRVAQGVVAAPPAPAGVVLRELAQERAKLLVDLVDDNGQSLSGSALANDATRSAFRHPELLFECNHHSTT
jgi:hypothetical protein